MLISVNMVKSDIFVLNIGITTLVCKSKIFCGTSIACSPLVSMIHDIRCFSLSLVIAALKSPSLGYSIDSLPTERKVVLEEQNRPVNTTCIGKMLLPCCQNEATPSKLPFFERMH